MAAPRADRRAARLTPGRDVARLLAGAWRREPEPPAFGPDALPAVLERTEARLLGAGCGALVWWRLREPDRRAIAAVRAYQRAYRYQVLHAAVDVHRIGAAVQAAREAGAEPLLLKGWATSRRYPDPGLRPAGDVDLCVFPGERAAVERALASAGRRDGALTGNVDLHTSLDDLADRPLDELLARAEPVPLGDVAATRVRVLRVEDHLRHLALHLLRHGAWRPLWLCDVAVVVESEGATLDWDLCLRGPRGQARRVACVLGLARRLLGAVLPAELPVSAARDARSVPRWLVEATLAQWGARYDRYGGEPLAACLTRPARLARAVGRRWPNPIEASVSVGASFGDFPRLPIQLGDVAVRAGRALAAGLRAHR